MALVGTVPRMYIHAMPQGCPVQPSLLSNSPALCISSLLHCSFPELPPNDSLASSPPCGVGFRGPTSGCLSLPWKVGQ